MPSKGLAAEAKIPDNIRTQVCGLQRNLVAHASLAQLAEHALRKRMVRGSIPLGG